MIKYRTSSRTAVERAKKNIVQYYAVIGLLEQMREYMGVLECLMPVFFMEY